MALSSFDDEAVDLRGYPFMPLHIARLQRSRAWLRCKRRPELAFYLMNLWMRAWHEVPAGSIENDDEVLADAAMCSEKLWQSIKGEVLRGWEVSGDRIQHPVVTEIAASSYEGKQKNHARTQNATDARKRKRLERVSPDKSTDPTDNPTDTSLFGDPEDDVTLFTDPNVTNNVTLNVTSDVTDNATSTNREEREIEDKDSLSSLRSDDDDTSNDEPPRKAAKSPAPAATPATGTRLPEDWSPGAVGEEFARGLGINPATEFPRFRDYWLSKPGKDGRKTDWLATWRNWCRNAGERVRPGFIAPSASSVNRAPVLSGSW
jgi:uncharacterized protein YdaU (DUF1376 family)